MTAGCHREEQTCREGSRNSIVRNPEWRPRIGPVDGRFRMADLLVFAFENKASLLAPLGD